MKRIVERILEMENNLDLIDFSIKKLCFTNRLNCIQVKIDLQKLLHSQLLIFLILKSNNSSFQISLFKYKSKNFIQLQGKLNNIYTVSSKDLKSIWDGTSFIVNPIKQINIFRKFIFKRSFLNHYLKGILSFQMPLEINLCIHPYSESGKRIFLLYYSLYTKHLKHININLNFVGNKYDSRFLEFKMIHKQIDRCNSNYLAKMSNWFKTRNRSIEPLIKIFNIVEYRYVDINFENSSEGIKINNSHNLYTENQKHVRDIISSFIIGSSRDSY